MFRKQATKEFMNINNSLENIKAELIKIKMSSKVIDELGFNYDVDGVQKELETLQAKIKDLKAYNIMKYKQQF